MSLGLRRKPWQNFRRTGGLVFGLLKEADFDHQWYGRTGGLVFRLSEEGAFDHGILGSWIRL